MVLIVCPECGKEVSTNASHCVHCGNPIPMEIAAADELKTQQESRGYYPPPQHLVIPAIEKVSSEKFKVRRIISPSLCGIILMCFMLPFGTASCMGQQLTLQGYQLAFGSKLPDGSELPIMYSVLATFSLAAIGLFIVLFNELISSVIYTLISAVGIASILIARDAIEREASAYGLQVSYDVGFYLVLVLYVVVVIYNIFAFLMSLYGEKT